MPGELVQELLMKQMRKRGIPEMQQLHGPGETCFEPCCFTPAAVTILEAAQEVQSKICNILCILECQQ